MAKYVVAVLLGVPLLIVLAFAATAIAGTEADPRITTAVAAIGLVVAVGLTLKWFERKKEPALAPPDPGELGHPSAPSFARDGDLFRVVLAKLRQGDGGQKTKSLFTLSLIVFVAVSWLFQVRSLPAIALLVVVLFLHELGHALAMRALGYRDVQILFLPMFGAVATGRRTSSALWRECVVLLAGPLPGLLLGTVLAMSPWAQSSPWGQTFSALLIGINAFNLLPLEPLDGGRLAGCLVFSRAPRLRANSAIVMSLILIYVLNTSLVVGVIILFAFTIPQVAQRRAAKVATVLRRIPEFRDAALPPEIAAADTEALHGIFEHCAKTVRDAALRPFDELGNHLERQTRLVYEILKVKPIPARFALPFGALYLGILVALAVVFAGA